MSRMEFVENWSIEPGVGVLVNGKPLGLAVDIEGPMVEPISGIEHLHILWMPLLAEGPAPRAGRPDGEAAGVSDE